MLPDPPSDAILLHPRETACLEALKAGPANKTTIALNCRQSLKQTENSLLALQDAGLADRLGRNKWQLTATGTGSRVETIPEPKRRRARLEEPVSPGSTAARLIARLARPHSGSELAEHLGVSPQRVHQLLVKLYAHGLVRLGDLGNVQLIAARHDDPCPLLATDAQRVFNAMPSDAATTAGKLASATRLPANRVTAALTQLSEARLIAGTSKPAQTTLYRLTPDGMQHPQRREGSAKPAQPVSLPVKSDRVYRVLSLIADQGSIRIRDARDHLNIEHQSLNALMQYLKRKGLVVKTDTGLTAPYQLSAAGSETRRELSRRRNARPVPEL